MLKTKQVRKQKTKKSWYLGTAVDKTCEIFEYDNTRVFVLLDKVRENRGWDVVSSLISQGVHCVSSSGMSGVKFNGVGFVEPIEVLYDKFYGLYFISRKGNKTIIHEIK